MAESIMPTLDLNNTFGAVLISNFISAALFGLTCTQVFYYFQNYASDGILFKGTVATLLILEALHSAFFMHAIYFYVILNYLNPGGLIKAVWTSSITLGISSAIILVVHLFYIRRLYHMSKKNIPLVALVTALALAHLVTGIVVTVRVFQLEFFSEFSTISKIVQAWASLGVATDIMIAGGLSFYLHTSRSGIKSTDKLINKLMVYSINNGILTSVFDIIVLIFVTTEPDNLIFFAFSQVLGNLYTNSMMATLNSRRSFAQHGLPVSRGRTLPSFNMQESGATLQDENPGFSGKGKRDFIEITATNDVHVI